MPNPVKIFVYGSLREGEYNNGRFGPQENLGGALTPHGYKLVALGAYPAMVQDPNWHAGVVGEVHKITPDMLPWFDRMESRAGYKRIPIEVYLGASVEEVWAYVMPNAPWMRDRVIPSGDWKKR